MDFKLLQLKNVLDESTPENAERMLRSFYRTIEPHKKRDWKNPKRISWEIYAEKDKIGFYLAIPKELERLIKSRLYDAYPQIEIVEVEKDYTENFAKPFTAEMQLHKHYMYATKMKSENTPLQSVLNSMSRLEEDERMLLQVSLVPINNKWQGRAYNQYRKVLFEGRKPRKYQPLNFKSGIFYSFKGLFFLLESILSNIIPLKVADGKNTPIERAELKATQQKIGLPAFNTSVRMAVESKDLHHSSTRLSELANSFIEMDADNEWRRVETDSIKTMKFIRERAVKKRTNDIVTTQELSSIIRLNNKHILVPELQSKTLRTHPIPNGLDKGLFLAYGVHGEKFEPVHINPQHVDDLVHPFIYTGAMGAGKTTIIMNQMFARALAGYGVILIDTQGDMSNDFISQLPEHLWDRVVWLDFGDEDYPVPLDLMEFVQLGSGNVTSEATVKTWAKNELVSIFKKMWGQNFGPQTEFITRNNITAVIETGGTFIDLYRMLVDDEFREETIAQIRGKAPFAWSFWRTFQDSYSLPQKMRMVMPSINKIGSFVEDETMLNIISQGKQTYNFRQLMDEGKIVIVTIPKGKLVGTWQLINSLIVSKVWLASLSRADTPIDQRKPCFLANDEAEDVINDNFPIMLSQSRKYRLGINLGFQYLDQIKQSNRKVFDALIGNRPSVVAMKIGEKDADVYKEMFNGYYGKEDFRNLQNLQGIARINSNGALTNPFTVKVPYNFFTGDDTNRTYNEDAILYCKAMSRHKYARPKEEVQKIVAERYESILASMTLRDDTEEMEDYEVEASEESIKQLRELLS